MKRSFCTAVAGLSLLIATSGANAAFISFTEGVLETDPVSVSTNIVLTAPIVTTSEYAKVVGFHHPAISFSPVGVGKRAAVLFEPGNPNLVSDYVLLTADPMRSDAQFGTVQDLVLEFFSTDIALSDLLTQLTASGFTYGDGVTEDGTLQDLSGFLGTLPEGLVVSALSRLPEPASVPEPASLALLGLGLAGLAFSHRRKAAV